MGKNDVEMFLNIRLQKSEKKNLIGIGSSSNLSEYD